MDRFDTHLEPAFFGPVVQDLVPWADPYIASLLQKVERKGGRLFDNADSLSAADEQAAVSDEWLVDEATPPLDVEEPDSDDDWSRR